MSKMHRIYRGSSVISEQQEPRPHRRIQNFCGSYSRTAEETGTKTMHASRQYTAADWTKFLRANWRTANCICWRKFQRITLEKLPKDHSSASQNINVARCCCCCRGRIYNGRQRAMWWINSPKSLAHYQTRTCQCYIVKERIILD